MGVDCFNSIGNCYTNLVEKEIISSMRNNTNIDTDDCCIIKYCAINNSGLYDIIRDNYDLLHHSDKYKTWDDVLIELKKSGIDNVA